MLVVLLSLSICLLLYLLLRKTPNPGLLKPGDLVFVGQSWPGTVVSYAEAAVGRIHNEGQPPGIYSDPNFVWVEVAEQLQKLPSNSLSLISGCPRRSEPVSRKLRDLPDTPFWEGDVVQIKETGEQLTIFSIDYLNLDKAPYRCKAASKNFSESELELVVRGPVYLRAQGQPIPFRSLEDELSFEVILGEFSKVGPEHSSLAAASAFLAKSLAHAIRKLPNGNFQCIRIKRAVEDPEFAEDILNETSRNPLVI